MQVLDTQKDASMRARSGRPWPLTVHHLHPHSNLFHRENPTPKAAILLGIS
jgi:hypothetical protein